MLRIHLLMSLNGTQVKGLSLLGGLVTDRGFKRSAKQAKGQLKKKDTFLTVGKTKGRKTLTLHLVDSWHFKVE